MFKLFKNIHKYKLKKKKLKIFRNKTLKIN